MKIYHSYLLILLILLASVGYSQTSKEYGQRGIVKYKVGDFEGAVSDFNKAIAIDPGYAYAYFVRGLSKFKLRDCKGAIADYNTAIEYKPGYALSYTNRGIAKHQLNNCKEAITDYNRAILLDPKYSANYSCRGFAKYDLHDFAGAILDFNKAIKSNSKDAKSYYFRGLAKITLRQNESGCRDIKEAGKFGFSKAFEALKQYCQNRSQTRMRSFMVTKRILDIPENEALDFLKDCPSAIEIKTFIVGIDTVDISIAKLDLFLARYPSAKPLYKYPDVIPISGQTTGRIDEFNSAETGIKPLTKQRKTTN